MDDAHRRQGFEAYIASYASITLDGISNKIDRNPATTTKGPITDPERRRVPTILEPWADGCAVLDDIFFQLVGSAAADNDGRGSEFPCRDHVEETGHELPVVNSEAAVHLFDVDTVYKPAKRIIDSALNRTSNLYHLLPIALRRHGYSVSPTTTQPGQVVFSPHSRTITIPDHLIGQKRPRPDSQESASTDDNSSQTPEDEIHVSFDLPVHGNPRPSAAVKTGPADYYCSFVWSPSTIPGRDELHHRLLMIAEAKAPHKLTRDLIEQGLGRNDNTIDTRHFIEPADQDQPDSGPNARPSAAASSPPQGDNYVAQMWLAAVSAQLYTALIERKRRYGYITTGQSYILLRIPPGRPTTMQYLLLPPLRPQPTRDVDGEATWMAWLAGTPLSRIACLALLAQFGDAELTDDEVDRGKTTAMIWKTPRHRVQSLETGSFHSTASEKTRGSDSDYVDQGEQQSRKRTRADEEQSPNGYTNREKRPRLSTPATMSTPPPKHTLEASQQTIPYLSPPVEAHDGDKKGDTIDLIPFCTTRCLRSLITPTTGGSEPSARGDPLCPNHQIHQQLPEAHPPSASYIQSLVQKTSFPLYDPEPLYDEEPPRIRTLYPTENVMYMNLYGAKSALFKVRIEGGYVLVAKTARSNYPGMKSEMLRRLKREAGVYRRLRTLQGHGIPLCLGVVDLSKGEIQLDAPRRSRSLHTDSFSACLLLSWAGEPFGFTTSEDVDVERVRLGRLREDLIALVGRIHELGVLHGDAARRNIVIDTVHDRPVIVDFELADSKGGFSGQLARRYSEVTDEMADQAFQRACEGERQGWLRELDWWINLTLQHLEHNKARRI